MAFPFVATSRRGTPWFSAGLANSFPDITDSGGIVLSDEATCKGITGQSGCKVFLAPEATDSTGQLTQLSDSLADQLNASLRNGDQVLVFQYKGKFHAIDNVKKCPHSSYPLSNGTPFDIEDFGIALSAGITCPKHGWSFDLFSGRADRGAYRLKLWEVELRESKDTTGGVVNEVWVRRKPRMG